MKTIKINGVLCHVINSKPVISIEGMKKLMKKIRTPKKRKHISGERMVK